MEKLEELKKLDYLTPEAKAAFFPCKSCSEIMTRECFDACMPRMRFENYRHRPGTDIGQMAPFPIEEILDEPDASRRLLTICIYLMSVVDYLQHPDEYQRNRELYKENGNGQNSNSQAGGRDTTNLQG